jgi:hypothetical protein
MKRTIFLAAAIFATIACAVTVFAQSGGNVPFDITGSLVLPMEDNVDMGIGLGVDAFFWKPISAPDLQIGGRFALNFITGDADGTVWEFLPTCRYWVSTNTNIRFFLEGSLGLYHARAEHHSETDLGLGLGAGMVFKNNVFAMPKINVSDFDYISLTVGKLF